MQDQEINRLTLKALLLSVISEVKGLGALPNAAGAKKAYKKMMGLGRIKNDELLAYIVFTYVQNELEESVIATLDRFKIPHGQINNRVVDVAGIRIDIG